MHSRSQRLLPGFVPIAATVVSAGAVTTHRPAAIRSRGASPAAATGR